MAAVFDCLTSPFCSICCGGLSVFAICILIPLGSLFQKDYRFLGEDWMTEARGEAAAAVAARTAAPSLSR